jgi:hypothetical protein
MNSMVISVVNMYLCYFFVKIMSGCSIYPGTSGMVTSTSNKYLLVTLVYHCIIQTTLGLNTNLSHEKLEHNLWNYGIFCSPCVRSLWTL